MTHMIHKGCVEQADRKKGRIKTRKEGRAKRRRVRKVDEISNHTKRGSRCQDGKKIKEKKRKDDEGGTVALILAHTHEMKQD